MTHILIPREPSAALLRPFIGCNTQELHEAWAAMVRIAEVQHARDGRSCLAQIKEPAGAAPAAVDGPAREEIAALRAEHGITSTGRGIKEFEQIDAFVRAVLQRWGAAPQEPAAASADEREEKLAPPMSPSEYLDHLLAAPAAPSAVATQVIENLLQLARIVNTAVEDWGETKEDDTMHVIFHKEQADKLEEILEFFDSLPDAPPEEGVILSGPSRAARVLRAQAAPAAPDGALCYIRPGATLPERHGFEVCRATDAGAMPVTRDGRATAPAAPAVDASRDTARMDWLEAQVVNVRAPLRYGSRDMFWASPEEVDGGPEGPSDLRARIDAAQAAAKGEHDAAD